MTGAKLTIFSERLKSLLDIRGMTQSQLSEKTGISQNTISLYINGKQLPNTENLAILTDQLEISADWLLGKLVDWREKFPELSKMHDPFYHGNKLAKLRQKLKLSQEEFSKKTKIPLKTLSQYENEKSIPKGIYLQKVLDAIAWSEAEISRQRETDVDSSRVDGHYAKPPEQPEDSLPAGHALVRLPRGDPGPVSEQQLDLLERALVILRCPPERGDWADALNKNINMFYDGVQKSDSLSGPTRKKAKGKSN